MNSTTNYKLNKPLPTEYVDIELLNQNMDTLDAEVFKKADKTDLKIVSDKISNLDISWSGIKGKPTTFPPETHTHSGFQGTNAPLEIQEWIDFHKFGSTADYEARIYLGDKGLVIHDSEGIRSINLDIKTIYGDLASLKQSVVNGKQAVVNAINGKIGYASGLTTNNSHGDYAWWITNQIKTGATTSDKEKILIALQGKFNAPRFDPEIKGVTTRIDLTANQEYNISKSGTNFKYVMFDRYRSSENIRGGATLICKMDYYDSYFYIYRIDGDCVLYTQNSDGTFYLQPEEYLNRLMPT